ncbi:MAG: hypothetical protein L0I24_20870, partial [Pseudonocardia sp.]|nr:hypothetical protein [Pseudonocardia sp.]
CCRIQGDHPRRRCVMPSLDVMYAARVQPGDLVLGRVALEAPTRPVQPMAAGMVVESVQVTAEPGSPRRKSYVWTWAGGAQSGTYGAAEQVMVLRGTGESA